MNYEAAEMWDAIKDVKFSKTLDELSAVLEGKQDDFFGSMVGVLDVVAKAMHAEAGTLWYYDRKGDGLIRPRSVYGGGDIKDFFLLPGEGIAGEVIEKAEGKIVADCQKDVRWAGKVDKKTGFRTNSMICVPLCTGNGAAFGCIQLINKTDGSLFDEKEFAFATRLSQVAAKHFEEYKMDVLPEAVPIATFNDVFQKTSQREMEKTLFQIKGFVQLNASDREKVLESARVIWNVFNQKSEKEKNKKFKLFSK